MLHFNRYGFLSPDEIIPTDFNTFRTSFVDAMADRNRIEIFEQFIEFLRSFLSDLNLKKIQMLLNGSFTTQKRNPNDLDLVIFIDLETFQKYEHFFYTKYRHDLLLGRRLDVYYVHVYPENHPNHTFTRSDTLYWINQFTSTRPDRKGKIYKKGLLQLTLTAYEIE